MTWAQKDDGSWSDPTLCDLSDRAYRLHDNCWTYAADKLTDGRLTRAEVARVASMFGLRDSACIAEAITELLTSKLWAEDANDYTLVDWLKQNRSKQDVEQARASASERMARWRNKSKRARQPR